MEDHGTTKNAIIYVVDNVKANRYTLAGLMKSAGLSTKAFSTGWQFLNAHEPNAPGCLLFGSDISANGGLALLRHMIGKGINIPVIIVATACDNHTAFQAAMSSPHEVLQSHC